MGLVRVVVGSFLFAAFFASASMAQVQRTFVSGFGSDSNPCSRTAPCRTFTQAISQTVRYGEVAVLDSAGYGPFVINKAISIIAPPGVYAGITIFSGDGIDINVFNNDIVTLHGLTLNNQQLGGSGIVFNSGLGLRIERCVMSGFGNGSGVLFKGAGTLEVKDSIVNDSLAGINVVPASGIAKATIESVTLEIDSVGVFAGDRSNVTVRNSVSSHNHIGFQCESATSASAEMNLENCVASHNDEFGIRAYNSSSGVPTVRFSNCTITDNQVGLQNFGALSLILSRGNNTVEGNATGAVGPIGSYTPK